MGEVPFPMGPIRRPWAPGARTAREKCIVVFFSFFLWVLGFRWWVWG